MAKLNRRRFLRGTLEGGAVTVALPFLNCFLDDSGTALASGAPLPLRFGTWSWGLGMSEAIFVPKKTGPNFDLPPEIAALAPVQEHINLFTNFHVFKDAAPNLCHHSGWVVLRSGIAPMTRETDLGKRLTSPSPARLATRRGSEACQRPRRATSGIASATKTAIRSTCPSGRR